MLYNHYCIYFHTRHLVGSKLRQNYFFTDRSTIIIYYYVSKNKYYTYYSTITYIYNK